MRFFLPQSMRVLLILPLLLVESCGGKNIGQTLDDLQGQVVSSVGLVGRTGSLTELQMLDTLQMKIQELRVQWKDILGENVDTLDVEQQKMLGTISHATQNVNDIIDHTVPLEDLAAIDGDVLLSKAGLSPTNEIRRIIPSGMPFREQGLYSYQVTLPLFGTGNNITGIRLND